MTTNNIFCIGFFVWILRQTKRLQTGSALYACVRFSVPAPALKNHNLFCQRRFGIDHRITSGRASQNLFAGFISHEISEPYSSVECVVVISYLRLRWLGPTIFLINLLKAAVLVTALSATLCI